MASGRISFRVGHGWDLHRLAPGRALMLGGIEVPSELGEDAHSDGDVLLHAIIDALLGAAALGDIGDHFPPSDERWKNADSRDLARRAAALVREAGWELETSTALSSSSGRGWARIKRPFGKASPPASASRPRRYP